MATEPTQTRTTEEDHDQAEARRMEDVRRQLTVVSYLSAMQRRFLIKYLSQAKPNATEAAAHAGYKWPDKQGPRLLKNSKVQDAIDEFFSAQEMRAGEVIARLSSQARAEYADYLEYREVKDPDTGQVFASGTYVNMKQLLADGKGHLIKSISYGRVGKDVYDQVVEFYDAHQALVDVGRYHGLFKDRTDLTSGDRPLEPFIYVPGNNRDDADREGDDA